MRMLGVKLMRRRAPCILHFGGGPGKGTGVFGRVAREAFWGHILTIGTLNEIQVNPVTYASSDLLDGTHTRSPSAPFPRIVTSAIMVGVCYYLGAKLGFALTLRPQPISTLWPPNSILLAGLLLTPTSWWWMLLLAALPAHLAVELNSGFPPTLVLGWFVSNCSEALIGAGIVRTLVGRPIRFDRSRDVGVFICG